MVRLDGPEGVEGGVAVTTCVGPGTSTVWIPVVHEDNKNQIANKGTAILVHFI
jgi:hypothetical protein